jgi:hypothetical protein
MFRCSCAPPPCDRDISAELFALGHTSKSSKPFTASSVRKVLV